MQQGRERAAHARVLRHRRSRLVYVLARSLSGLLRFPLLLGRGLRARATADALGRAAQEETVRDAALQLVRIGNGVQLVEAYDALEVRDAADYSISSVGLDDVAGTGRAVAVVEV